MSTGGFEIFRRVSAGWFGPHDTAPYRPEAQFQSNGRATRGSSCYPGLVRGYLSGTMGVLDLFSKRALRAKRAANPDVYHYDRLRGPSFAGRWSISGAPA